MLGLPPPALGLPPPALPEELELLDPELPLDELGELDPLAPPELGDDAPELDGDDGGVGIEGVVGVPIHEAQGADWDRVIDINLKGVWLCLRHEIRAMREHGGGAIVNTASVAGLVGGTFGASYFASKHGVVGLSKAAAVENGTAGIRVNAVCPGVIKTEMADISATNRWIDVGIRSPARHIAKSQKASQNAAPANAAQASHHHTL